MKYPLQWCATGVLYRKRGYIATHISIKQAMHHSTKMHAVWLFIALSICSNLNSLIPYTIPYVDKQNFWDFGRLLDL